MEAGLPASTGRDIMTATTFRRWIAVFAFGVLLGMPLTSTAGPRIPVPRIGAEEGPPALFSKLWSLLTRAWAKEGCHIDPYGRCLDASKVTKNGCSVDPNGRCEPDSQIMPKNGCSIDPYGRCLPGS